MFKFIIISLVCLFVGLVAFQNIDPNIKTPIDDTSISEIDETKVSATIEGEVVIPGIYRLDKEATLNDLIVAAGGLLESADNDAINKDVLLMPVVKANGYGTYINLSTILDDFKIVCVALVDEGIILRENGYKGDILVINQPDINEVNEVFKYNLIVGLSDEKFLDEMVKFDDKFRVHIEVDTGMGRTGIRDLNLVNKLAKYPNIVVEGVYSHLSSADDDLEFTNNQINKFNEYVTNIKEVFPDIKYIHLAASNEGSWLDAAADILESR